MYKFECDDGNQCKNIIGLTFPKGPCLDLVVRRPTRLCNDESNYQWQQIINGYCINISINGVSTIFGGLSKVIEKHQQQL